MPPCKSSSLSERWRALSVLSQARFIDFVVHFYPKEQDIERQIFHNEMLTYMKKSYITLY